MNAVFCAAWLLRIGLIYATKRSHVLLRTFLCSWLSREAIISSVWSQCLLTPSRLSLFISIREMLRDTCSASPSSAESGSKFVLSHPKGRRTGETSWVQGPPDSEWGEHQGAIPSPRSCPWRHVRLRDLHKVYADLLMKVTMAHVTEGQEHSGAKSCFGRACC